MNRQETGGGVQQGEGQERSGKKDGADAANRAGRANVELGAESSHREAGAGKKEE